MNDIEIECLAADDVRLFHHGACHIFAVALQRRLHTESFILKRIQLSRDLRTELAYHVVATNGGFVVDVCGIKREEDYKKWLLNKPHRSRFSQPTIPSVEFCDTNLQELVDHASQDDTPEASNINSFGLFTGSDFVRRAYRRALKLINDREADYRVSLLL